jgi:hypothetical protein
VENYVLEPSLETNTPEGLKIPRTLFLNLLEMPVRILNTTCHYKTPMKGCPLAHCWPVTLVAPLYVLELRTQGTLPKLQDVISTARANLNNEEIKELGELIT